MLISIPNGNTIEMSVDQYLKLSDDNYKYLMAAGGGETINDPFHQSALDELSEEPTDAERRQIKEWQDSLDPELLDELYGFDELPSSLERLADLDIPFNDFDDE